MGMNDTPSSERIHIGFFGKRNAGKSSVVNAITGQSLSIVSEIKGTTTDPVYKAMELLPIGPVVIIDTPGIDDEGTLGELRIKKSRQVLNKTDIAVLVIDSAEGKSKEDDELISLFKEKNISHLVVYNKSDISGHEAKTAEGAAQEAGDGTGADNGTGAVNGAGAGTGIGSQTVQTSETVHKAAQNEIYVSAKTGYHIHELKEMIAVLAVTEEPKCMIVGDLIKPSDFVVLVVPIDKAAPKGRLILPQQQTIRDILDTGAVSIVVKETELRETLASLGKKPSLVITDSQVFERVSAETPEDIPLTSFSILFARYKGSLASAVNGARALDSLKDGDTVLISEGCTHHRQCGDIGTEKLPRWIRNYTGKQINFKFTSGTEFPEDLSGYKLIIHCGGCMLNEREVKYRGKCAADQQVPFTNYGISIAYMHGILNRSIAMFPDLLQSPGKSGGL